MKRTMVRDLHALFYELAEAEKYNFDAYKDDPVGFAAALGVKVTDKQAEVLRALVTNDWVTVRSGRRVGKTRLAAIAALWFWATRGPMNRVILTSPKLQNIQEVVWREVQYVHRTATRPLGGTLAQLAATGLKADDGRQIVGIVAGTEEAFQGLAGPRMFFIVDEASGVEEKLFTALFGNLAGGGKLLLIGNPTKTTGTFYDSHKSPDYVKFHIPSTSSPNVVAGRMLIDGLADNVWLAKMANLWGKGSPMWQVHVDGNFVEGAEGQLFPPSVLSKAEEAWADAPMSGPLVIGCDPAGEGADGDESAFVVRRGKKIIWLHARRGLTPDAHLNEITGLIATHRGDTWDMPRVVLDRDGLQGARVYGVLRAYLETHKEAFHLTGIRGSEAARRRPLEVCHVRDEMWFNLADAFRGGLGIPPDLKLQGDLGAIRFDKLDGKGRATVVKKNIIRKELGRSPDLGDALCLAAYDGPDWVDEERTQARIPEGGAGAKRPKVRARTLDPYDAEYGDAGGRAFDPYRR